MKQIMIIAMLILYFSCSSTKEIYHKTVDELYYENCSITLPLSMIYNVKKNKKVDKKFIGLLNEKTNIYKQYCYGKDVNQNWTKIIKSLDTTCWLSYTNNKQYYWLKAGKDLVDYYYLLELSKEGNKKIYRLNFLGNRLESLFLIKEITDEKICDFKKRRNKYTIKCNVSPNDTQEIEDGKVINYYNLTEIEVNKRGKIMIK